MRGKADSAAPASGRWVPRANGDPAATEQRWSVDFVHTVLIDRRRFRVFAVLDAYNHHRPHTSLVRLIPGSSESIREGSNPEQA